MPATKLQPVATFNILDHISALDVVKETHTAYHCRCPVCNAGGFKIDKKSGAYDNFNCDCDKATIRQAIAPLDSNQRRQPRRTVRRPKAKAKPPAPIPETSAALAALPAPGTPPSEQNGHFNSREHGRCSTVETQYDYGDRQFVKRTELFKDGQRIDKFVIPYHLNERGEPVKGKGENVWQGYRMAEAVEYCQDKWLLAGEGEKVVEAARFVGLAAITWQGASWQPADLARELRRLKAAGATGIAYAPDLDAPGLEKAKKVRAAAAEAGLPYLELDLKLVANSEEQAIEGYDLADFVQARLDGSGKDAIAAELRDLLELTHEAVLDGDGGDGDGNEPEGDGDGDGDSGGDFDPFDVGDRTFEDNCLQYLFEDGEGDWTVIDGAFYRWNEPGGHWVKQDDGTVKKAIAERAGQCYILTGKRLDVLKFPFATATKIKSAFEFCRTALSRQAIYNDHLRAFLNGTVDQRTGELQPHDRANFLTSGIAAEYQPGAECPEVFSRFIANSFGADLLPLVRALTSMLIDPTAPFGYFPHLIGASGGGKGTLLRFWADLFPASAVRAISEFSAIATAEGRHQNLSGVGFATIPDIGGFVKGLRAFYELVDNGDLSGRGLFNPDGYQKRWNVRFAVASVDHLQIENAGDGWQRRCIPLPVQRRTGEPDPDLRTKLAERRADVISWALAMPREERDRHLHHAAELFPRIAQTKRQSEVYGDSARLFVECCLQPSLSERQVTSAELHSLYRAFCKATGHAASGFAKFASHLKTVIPDHWRERQVQKLNGKTVTAAPSHWANLSLSHAELFKILDDDDLLSHSLGQQHESPDPQFVLIKSQLQEGGLQAFEEFNAVPVNAASRLAAVETVEQLRAFWHDVGKESFGLSLAELDAANQERILALQAASKAQREAERAAEAAVQEVIQAAEQPSAPEAIAKPTVQPELSEAPFVPVDSPPQNSTGLENTEPTEADIADLVEMLAVCDCSEDLEAMQAVVNALPNPEATRKTVWRRLTIEQRQRLNATLNKNQ